MSVAAGASIGGIFLVAVALAMPVTHAVADTGTSLGDRSGEGSTAFTGLAQSPEANLFTGALGTRVSIQVPPGRKHMTPDLAVEYSSSAGPSPYGYGWDLTIGRIERTTRWGVPRCDSAHFDEFVLILPGGVSAELVEDAPGTGEYRPRVEQAYLSATFSPGTNSWTARDAAGMKYTFGDVDNARLGTMVSNPPVEQTYPDGSCDFTTAWALTKIEDSNGNTISVTWRFKDDSNLLLPLLVEYGGHSSGTPGHFHKVQFYWLDNGVASPTYRAGVPQGIDKRLWKIEVSSTKAPTPGVFRTYIFIGDGLGALYQLQTVSVVDLPEQSFVYSDWAGPGHASSPLSVAVPSSFGTLRHWSPTQDVVRSILDMNGDGLLDLVRGNLSTWQVHFGWVDEDQGVVTFGFNAGATSWTTPNALVREVKLSGCPGAGLCTVRDTFDITGDGVADYVVATDGSADWQVHAGRKSGALWGFDGAVNWPAPSQRIRETIGDDTHRDVIDMNGDGLPDLVVANQVTGKWLVYRNTGSGFAAQALEIPLPDVGFNALSTGARMLADFNGDGLPDIIKRGVTEYSSEGGFDYYAGTLLVYFNTGQGFSDPPLKILTPHGSGCFPVSAEVFGSPNEYATVVDLLDVNGDGLPDCINQAASGWRVLLNTGGDLEEIEYVQDPGQPYIMAAQATRVWTGVTGEIRRTLQVPGGDGHQLIDMIDLNGDGFLDRVNRGAGNWSVQLNLQPSKPMVLNMMENGLGGTNTIKYEPSSHFPHVDDNGAPTLPFITWVVTATRLNDGRCVPPPGSDVFDPSENTCIGQGNELLSYNTYSDGLFAVETNGAGELIREFRGFGLVDQRDVFGNRTQTLFHQETNTKGLVESVAIYDSQGTFVTLETNSWSEASFGTGGVRTQLWLDQNFRSSWDGTFNVLDVTAVNDRPDLFGNITHTWTDGTSLSASVHSTNEYATATNNEPRDKPKRSFTWDDLNSNGTYESGIDRLLEEKKFYYDAQQWGELTKGDLTKVESYLNTENRWLATTMQYDGYGNITRVTDAQGRFTQTNYNFDGKGAFLYPTLVVSPLSHTTLTSYDYRHGKPTSVVGPNGTSTKVDYGYDTLGRIVVEIRPGDTVTSPTVLYTYDFADAPATANVPWELSSVKVSRKQDDASTPVRTMTSYFDAIGRQRYTVSPRVINGGPALTAVRSNEVVFDAAGNVIRTYLPYTDGGTRGAYTAFDYHLNGGASIDPLRRVWKTTLPDTVTTTLTYHFGYLTETYDPAGEKTVGFTDAMGRAVRSQTYHRPSSAHVLYSSAESEYDGLGRLLAVYQNRNLANIPMKTMSYDTLGRKIATTDRDSGTWTYGYDDVGNLLWQDDPKAGQHLQFCYDALNRPVHKCSINEDRTAGSAQLACFATSTSSCASGLDVHYEYGDVAVPLSKGYLTRVVDDSGETRVLGYDTRGRQTGAIRRINVQVDGGAQLGEAKFEYQYNTTDEITQMTYPDGEVVQMTYDKSGQPTTLCNTSGNFYVESAHYDIFGHLTSLVKGNGAEDQAQYAGPSQNHRLQTLTFSGQGFGHAQVYGYNSRGQVTQITNPSIPVSSPAHNGGTYGYDDLGRLVSYTSAVSGSTPRVYGYNEWGNITSKDGMSISYGTPTNPAVGPHKVTALTMSGGSPQALTHDANGNRLKSFQNGSLTAFGNDYDAENRLASTTLSGGAEQVYFHYDDGGQLKAKVIDTLGTAEVTKYYSPQIEVRPDGKTIKSHFFGGQRVASLVSSDSSWQDDTLASASWESPVQFASVWGNRPVLQVTLSTTAQTAAATTLALLIVTLFLLPPGRRRRAVIGMRLGRGPALSLALLVATGTMPWPLLIQPAEASCTGCNCPTPIPPLASDISYFHYDHLGSPLLITDGNGDVAEQIRYHPYGAVRGRFNSAGAPIGEPGPDEVRYEFTGYEAERNTGLLYANARFYDPELGSFMSHDPAAQFWSPYTYVGWDPVNRTDPSGAFDPTGVLWAIAIGFAVGFTASTFNALANGASFGESLKAGLIGGALGAVTAPIGAYVLQPALAGLVGAVFAAGEATAASVASSILFVSGLGQAFYSGTQGDSSVAFGLAIGLTVGAILAKGAQASGISTGRQLDFAAREYGQGFGAGSSSGGLGSFLRTAGRVAVDVIGKLWALPNTIIGGAVGLGGVPFGARVELGNNAIQFLDFPLGGAGEGLTLGNVQIFPRGSDPATSFGFYYGSPVPINLGPHEQAHTYQYQVFGPTFLPAYFLSGGISASNPFELAANRYALGGSFLP